VNVSDKILLHPTLGVNARMTTCVQCGADGQELLLLGNRNYWVECSNCKARVYGGFDKDGTCPSCGSKYTYGERHELTDGERVPHGLCKECEDNLQAQKDMVAAGGVYFRCKKCGTTGATRPEAGISKAVREHSKIEAPNPVGVELDECPQCKKTDEQG
jgi:hypothetical protein